MRFGCAPFGVGEHCVCDDRIIHSFKRSGDRNDCRTVLKVCNLRLIILLVDVRTVYIEI